MEQISNEPLTTDVCPSCGESIEFYHLKSTSCRNCGVVNNPCKLCKEAKCQKLERFPFAYCKYEEEFKKLNAGKYNFK